jgi:putative Holliday junction resolvase
MVGWGVRFVAFDVGRKRTGVAVSDASGTLARPLATLGGERALADAEGLVARLAEEEEGLAGVVVGLPVRLDGTPNDETPRVLAFAEALRRRCPVPVVLQDERLTSVEAEQRLALREPDWRRRKARLDAASAAVILQDYLDSRAPARTQGGDVDDE